MDFVQLLLDARLANAAYIQDREQSKAAFKPLGHDWLGMYQDCSHQAVLTRSIDGAFHLNISGSRVSGGSLKNAWGDLLRDIDTSPLDVDGHGALVTAGAFDGLSAMWRWAKRLAGPDAIWEVRGHSLGGWRTRYTPMFVEDEKLLRLVSFAAPKGGNDIFWRRYGSPKLVSVVAKHDLWAGYPLKDPWVHPPGKSLTWVKNKVSWAQVSEDEWSGGWWLGDHAIEGCYIETLAGLAAQAQPAAA